MIPHLFTILLNITVITMEALMAKAIKDVLEDAERQIQKTHPDIISGEVRDFLKVHRKQAKHDASGQTIKQTKVGGRITYYTADQEEFS